MYMEIILRVKNERVKIKKIGHRVNIYISFTGFVFVFLFIVNGCIYKLIRALKAKLM